MSDPSSARDESNGIGILPVNASEWSLLLDVDGTLLEIARTPDSVVVPPGLGDLLCELEDLLGGALALVSGRPISAVDRIFAPHRFSVAGVHGADVRIGVETWSISADPARLDPLRHAFGAFVREHRGTRWEDKVFSLTLHFRENPAAAGAARLLAQSAVLDQDDRLEVVDGKMVVEVRFREANKGAAVARLMRHNRFAGRLPVYLGDDITDEDAFAEVNRWKGVSVVVGDTGPTAAARKLPSVSAVHDWLKTLAGHLRTMRNDG